MPFQQLSYIFSNDHFPKDLQKFNPSYVENQILELHCKDSIIGWHSVNIHFNQF
jgi:hypothetical protein